MIRFAMPFLALRLLRTSGASLGVLLLACGSSTLDQQSPPPPPPGTPPPPPPPLPPPPPPEQVTVTITVDTLQRFQVINGWEAVAQAGQDEPGFSGWASELFAQAANDLGINRMRIEVRAGAENSTDWFAELQAGHINGTEWRTHRYETINDNGDPTTLNAAGFHFSELDRNVEQVLLPFKQRVEARGERLYVNLNYVAFTTAATYVHINPAEYAEFVLAAFRHLRDKYGLVPDGFETILEPDNATAWTGAKLGPAIAAAAARLAADGFHPEFITPSTMNMGAVPAFFDPVTQVPGVLGAVKEIAYHRYQGVSDAHLTAIAQRGALYGFRTAMLEHIGSGADDLYKDLTLGNVSAWQQYTLGYPTTDNGAQYYVITNGHPVLGSRSLGLRQYFKYIRAGAVRVRGTSDKAAIRSTAYVNTGGGPVVVIHATGTETYGIEGLRPGRYLVTSSSAATPTIGEVMVGVDGVLRWAGALDAVVTVAWQP